MKTATTTGTNRTGISVSPANSKELIKAAEEGCRDAPPGDDGALECIRKPYAADAGPIGSVPLPAGIEAARASGASLFVDKLGERLAFERTGVRLYQALLTKHDTSPGWAGGPARDELERFRAEELAHFGLVHEAMLKIGADPTAETPAADVIGVASLGVLEVITDPRTTLAQSLDALLTAELTDNDGWDLLIKLSRAVGHDDLAAPFEKAKKDEEIHLAAVRKWLLAKAAVETKSSRLSAESPKSPGKARAEKRKTRAKR